MRFFKTIVILFLLFAAGQSFGQQAELDSMVRGIDTLRLRNPKADSLLRLVRQRVDSIDQINRNINREIQRLTNTPLNISVADSLKAIVQRNDGIMKRLRSNAASIDSLKQRGMVSTDVLDNKLSSLQGEVGDKIDSLTGIREDVNAAKSRIASAERKLEETLGRPTKEVNDGLTKFKDESFGMGTLPEGVSAPNADLPDLSLDVPELDNGLDQLNLGEKDLFSLPEANLELPETNFSLENPLQGRLDGLSGISEDVSGYAADVKNITNGNLEQVTHLDNDLVSALPGEQLAAVQGELEAANTQIAAIKSLHNPAAFKKQLMAKSAEMVATQLASYQAPIQDVIGKVSRHQQRLGTVFAKVKGLPKRPNKIARPPFIERFVPAITFQPQRADYWLVDITPSVHYRVRSIFSAGAAWNERIVFDKNFDFYWSIRMYGLRTFYEASVRKGLWVRAEVERMNAFVPFEQSVANVGSRRWMWNYLVGAKKDFSFNKYLAGDIQFMYNLYDPGKTGPYLSKFNVRFGFEFPLRTKKSRTGVGK